MYEQQLILILVILAPFMIGYFLPEFSARFLGPAILVITGLLAAVFHSLFVPFRSEGSPAGLILPAIAWAGAIVGCISGVLLIVTGKMRMRRTSSTTPNLPRVDHVPQSGAHTALPMLNVALGVIVAIAPFAPFYHIFSSIYAPLLRSMSMAAWETLRLASSYFVPAVLLYAGFHMAGLHRKLVFNKGITWLLFACNLVVLYFQFAPVAGHLYNASARSWFVMAGLLREFSWLAWSGVLVGLFLFWRVQAERTERLGSLI